MGVFRRRIPEETTTTADGRTSGVITPAAPGPVAGPPVALPLGATVDAPAVGAAVGATPLGAAVGATEPAIVGADNASGEDSDVFLCRRSSPPGADETAATAQGVTLFVYGWHSVEPGPLSWAFPNLKAALDAVRTMRNAVQWCICSGGDWPDVDAARQSGAVLIEQLG